VVVIGDAMLDAYVSGSSGRLAQEAPVPVVAVYRSDEAPGGAANVAANATGQADALGEVLQPKTNVIRPVATTCRSTVIVCVPIWVRPSTPGNRRGQRSLAGVSAEQPVSGGPSVAEDHEPVVGRAAAEHLRHSGEAVEEVRGCVDRDP